MWGGKETTDKVEGTEVMVGGDTRQLGVCPLGLTPFVPVLKLIFLLLTLIVKYVT